ncbi:hypothetical protein Taro_000602, partial [Colocasia esculenta]|nr:hypothetical protein [Colocasia esculenta]
MIYVYILSGTNISCKGSVNTTINGVDTMGQNKGRNVKKSSSSVDTSPGQQFDTTSSQVDTRDLSQGIDLPVWDSVSTHLKGRSTHSGISELEDIGENLNTNSPSSSGSGNNAPDLSTPQQVDTTPSRVDTLSLRSTLTSSSVDTDPLPDSINPSAPVKRLMFLRVDPTVALLLVSGRRFEPFPSIPSSIPSPSVFSHSSLSIIPDSTLHCFNGAQAGSSPWCQVKGYGKARSDV